MRSRRTIILIFLSLFFLVGGVDAREVFRDEQCTITADRVIVGDVFVLCGTLVVDGRIEGNLIGAARSASIKGEVGGSIYLIAGQVDFGGSVGGSLHFGGLILNTTPEATFTDANGGLIAVNLSSKIASGVDIPGSVLNVGYQLIIDGDVEREVNFWGSALTISGSVGTNVTATVGNSASSGVSSRIETLLIPFRFIDVELIDPGFILTQSGRINGSLAYTATNEGIIDGQTAGDVVFRSSADPITLGNTVEQNARSLRLYLSQALREFTTLAFFGAIGLLLLPRQMQSPLRPMLTRPISTIGVGMLSFILSFPIVLIILLVSLLLVVILSVLPLDTIVLVIALVLALVNIGGASLFYFTAIFVGRAIVGLALGRFLLRIFRYDDGTRQKSFIALAIGLLILSLFGAIPVIGWGFQALSLFLGLGAILSVLRTQFRRFKEASAPPPIAPVRYAVPRVPMLPAYTGTSGQYTPPTLTDVPSQPTPPTEGLGNHNLPEGFKWWQE